MASRKNNLIIPTLAFLTFLAISIWTVYLKEPDNKVHIFTLNVGQGDSILIQKGDQQLLIDGGPDDKVISELGKVMPLEDRKIEQVILTHPHADHLSGLMEVLDRYQIGEIELSGASHTSQLYIDFLRVIKEKNIPVSQVFAGKQKPIFDRGEIVFIWPEENQQDADENINNNSVVFKFSYGNFSALFPGDLEIPSWQKIIAKNKNQISAADYLKVPHHGSKNGIDEEVISIIKPKNAVISLSADNKYGFPHKQIIDLLQKIGADIHRTDLQGTIDIIAE